MRAISKRSEPDSLRRYRATGGTYADFRDTQELRESLVTEQRGLCCYCMCRISADSNVMKIEHWQPQSRFPAQQLVYANLLGACLGGQNQADRHCDTLKGGQDLKFNPANPLPKIESLISYGLDGTISSQDREFDSQLETILGLNIPKLVNSRKGTLDGVLDWWRIERERRQRPVPTEVIERMRDKLLSQTLSNLEPFVQVKVWWLEQRLARSAARPSSRSVTTRRSRP
jgi:uncharacterized protein (TIGR02646 family)